MSESLTLEKIKIAERLSALETTLKIFIEKTDKNSDKMNHIILGNGSPGLIDRVRVLETSEDGRRIYVKAAALTIVGLVVKNVWDIFTK